MANSDRLAVEGGPPASRKFIPIAKPLLGAEEVEAVKKVVLSGVLRSGPLVKKFEEKFAEYVGARFSVAVNSGTSALLAAYSALFERGSEILVPSFTFIATASMLVAAGLKPVFSDITLDTYSIDLDDALSKASRRTRGLVVVNLYGLPGDLERARREADEMDIRLVVDAAQSLGSSINGRESGGYGDAACYSFYPSKNITTGEGGMVVTNDEELAEKVRLIRNHGQRGEYVHEILGYNLRMGEMEAAIGLVQLAKIENFIHARRRCAERLRKRLSGVSGLFLPDEPPGYRHTYNLFTVRIDPDLFRTNRDEIVKAIRAEGVDARIYYPLPLHKQPIFKNMAGELKLPNSELASKTVFSLPCHPGLTEDDVEIVALAVDKVLRRYQVR